MTAYGDDPRHHAIRAGAFTCTARRALSHVTNVRVRDLVLLRRLAGGRDRHAW